jgi:hypothetical protein
MVVNPMGIVVVSMGIGGVPSGIVDVSIRIDADPLGHPGALIGFMTPPI